MLLFVDGRCFQFYTHAGHRLFTHDVFIWCPFALSSRAARETHTDKGAKLPATSLPSLQHFSTPYINPLIYNFFTFSHSPCIVDCTHIILGDTGRPEDRVVRIVNLHYEADGKNVRRFLGDSFTVIDFTRGVNTKTNKNTVGYVLLATEQQRIDAQTLSGSILDREVKVVPAQTGFRSK